MLVRENEAAHRYELLDDDEVAGFIDYICRGGLLWLVHTEVDAAHSGTGAGAFLVRQTLDDARARSLKVVPSCPFVAGWIRRHPDYQDLVDEKAFRELRRSRGAGRRRTARPPRFDPSGKTVGEACSHVPDLQSLPSPWPADGCAECLAKGVRNWLHLRVCQSCGHVGCCDGSPGKHATAHVGEADHPLVRSYEVGEVWWYCYVDTVTFEIADLPAVRGVGTEHRSAE